METKRISHEEILDMSKVYRLNLINSISGFKSSNMIGTVDENSHNNLAIFSSVVHLGSNPPLLGMILRPTTVPRHTYENIKNSGFYTINNVVSSIIEKAHQTSAKYGKEESEFDKVGLNPVYLNDFPAPYVEESTLQIGMEFVEELDIQTNRTKLIIGKVVEINLPAESIIEDGSIDHEIIDTTAISGLDTYWSPKKLKRFGYARP